MKTRLVSDPVVVCLPMAVLLSLAFSPLGADPQVPEGWEVVRFDGETTYRFDGECWQARAEGSASGLAYRQTIDLDATPVLHWRWRSDQQPAWPRTDEQQRKGDDFRARVYVIREGWLPWQTRAINYVWSRQYPAGRHWPNPFASQAHMVVVQGPGESDPDSAGWHSFSRNVRQDFRRYHGMDIDRVDGVAIMTDGDNTGTTVTACYQLPVFRTRR